MRILIPVILCFCAACSDGLVSTEPSRNKPLRPKATNNIGQFKGDKQVVRPKVNITNPVTGPLQAFEPMKQQIAQLGIDHAINLFRALEDRYPKDHNEFMQRVIKENNIRLPEPSRGFAYQYDVENHKLLVVKDAPEAE